ncbi:endonuclease VII domain-containing protein [Candidatus Pelagibacter sp.]|nr:endonuclease VII domain-containing protein [Candidatus Pelagibacter sp.]
MKNIIVKGYDISKQNLKGMTPEQYIKLMEFQKFSCPLSGKKFKYSFEEKKFIYKEGRKSSIIAPPVDHDHNTGFIRGILSEKLNLLLDQWEKKTYGNLSKPKELTDYQNDPPAYKCIGKIKYK